MLIKNYRLMVCEFLKYFKFFLTTLLYIDTQYELPADLQRILDDDSVLLQQQIESIKLEQLHTNLKTICERTENQETVHRPATIPFFTGPNASAGMLINFDGIYEDS